MQHYVTSVPTVFGDSLGGDPIGGSSNPGHGHGNTFRFTVMGTYTFSPTVVLDAHYGWARQGTASEQPGLGKKIGSDVLGIPGTNGPRAFESGWPEFQFNQGDDFATLGVPNNFMPYYRQDPQHQYVANLSVMKGRHNLRFGADVYHMALAEAQAEFLGFAYGAQGGFNFDRGPSLRCERQRLAADVTRFPPIQEAIALQHSCWDSLRWRAERSRSRMCITSASG